MVSYTSLTHGHLELVILVIIVLLLVLLDMVVKDSEVDVINGRTKISMVLFSYWSYFVAKCSSFLPPRIANIYSYPLG